MVRFSTSNRLNNRGCYAVASGHRLSRFRKNKRRLRERLRQRIFFRDKVVPEAMEKPRVLVLTGAGISAESGIRTFRAADGLWEATSG